MKTGLLFCLIASAVILCLVRSFAAPDEIGKHADLIAELAAKYYAEGDLLRAEALCNTAIDLDPYCIPARRLHEKITWAPPPLSMGREASQEMVDVADDEQRLHSAEAEFTGIAEKVAEQCTGVNTRRDFDRAQLAWKQFSRMEAQSRATQITRGERAGFRVNYLQALTELPRECIRHLRQRLNLE